MYEVGIKHYSRLYFVLTWGSSSSSSDGFIQVYTPSPSLIRSPLKTPSKVEPPAYVTLAFPGRGNQFVT